MRPRVVRFTLDGWVAPERVMRRFGVVGDVVWIDAATFDSGHPRESLIGWGHDVLRGQAKVSDSVAAAFRMLDAEASVRAPAAHPLGRWGFLGYGAGAELIAPGDEGLADAVADPEHPDLALLAVDRALVFAHAATGGGDVSVVMDETPDNRRWRAEIEEWWSAATVTESGETSIATETHPPTAGGGAVRAGRASATWATTDAEYRSAIARCQAAIYDGDAYQLCLTTSVTVPTVEPALEVYLRLRRVSPAPQASFLRLGDVTVLGASPERFLTLDPGGHVSTSPIKGTRPRGSTPADDDRLARELAASAKERAENLMIVDLMRNDLSRVCDPATVRVPELLAVHRYEHVHQLVSTVTGTLEPGMTGVDVIRATFPPGSMTGTPKRRAVELLAAWEAAPRGVYAGAIGRLGRDGSVDLSVVIRSIVMSSGTARIGAGGGITASSDVEEELEEVRTKARALLGVL